MPEVPFSLRNFQVRRDVRCGRQIFLSGAHAVSAVFGINQFLPAKPKARQRNTTTREERSITTMPAKAIPSTTERLAALQKQDKKQWSNSKIIDVEKEKELPRFTGDQLTKGAFLGQGGFCTVDQIRAFKIAGKTSDSKQSDEEVEFEDQTFIVKHCKRANGDARYAIKYLSPEVIKDMNRYLQGLVDFATETHFLTAIDHPNIVKLRAVEAGTPFDKKYFLVLDRLYDIMDKKIPQWSKESKRLKGAGKLMDKGGKKSLALLDERLVAASDLSDAIAFMHGHK